MEFKIKEKHYLNNETTIGLEKFFASLMLNYSNHSPRIIMGEFCPEQFNNGMFDNINEDNVGSMVESCCAAINKSANIVKIGHSNVITDHSRYVSIGYTGLCYPFNSVYFKWDTFSDNTGEAHAMYGFFYNDEPICCFFIETENYVPYCKETIKFAKSFLNL